MPPSNPKRRPAYENARADLIAARAPIASYCRRGRQIGRATSTDPVRAMNKELGKALSRVRAQLAEKSPAAATRDRIGTHAIRGIMGRFQQALYAADEEHWTAQKLLGSGRLVATKGGGRVRSMRELNEEAQRLLVELRRARRIFRTEYERFVRQEEAAGTLNRDRQDRLRWAQERAVELRESADRLSAELRESATRRTPVPRRFPRRPSTRTDILNVMSYFYGLHGRVPRVAELKSTPVLPHYTTLYRVFGQRPLTSIDTIVTNSNGKEMNAHA
jgi:hypothetical protein